MSDIPSESENSQTEAAVNTISQTPTDADIDPVLLHSICTPTRTESGGLIPQKEFVSQL
jgi:hypothetical protein